MLAELGPAQLKLVFLITNLFPNTIVESMPMKQGSMKKTIMDKSLKVIFQTFNEHGTIQEYIMQPQIWNK